MNIYCDGACSGNPGKGAWAYVVFNQNGERICCGSGYEELTTNNRMELRAVIEALQGFNNCQIVLDSKYVKDGVTMWIHRWKINQWKTSSGELKNLDLWKEIDLLTSKKDIVWTWQKGHANSLHDYADELARASIIR